MSLSRYILIFAVALVLATALGLSVHTGVRYAYSHHLLSYDTSDGRGHGPDPGTLEDQHAFAYGTAHQSREFGLVAAAFGFGVPFLVAFVRRNRVA